MRALLVYPEFPATYWGMTYTLRFTGNKATLPPLGLITVAALFPTHWNPRLIDMNVEPLRDVDLQEADVVMLGAMGVQSKSLHDVLRRCRRLGVPTVVGGPYATGEPERLPDADYLVLGEVEETLAGFCAAFEAGRAPRLTQNTEKPDVTASPIPRYDLLRKGAYLQMALQYSRGCPFSCEFCDIIVMFGRVPRTKTARQVENELDAILATGFRASVFFVDDNFIGNKKAVKLMLPDLKAWQEKRGWPLRFYTEASLNLAEDSALMNAMRESGFWSVFIGIESPSEEALLETRKNQNVKSGTSLTDRVHEVLRHGLDVWAGFIIGFDSDEPDIFERQIEFIDQAAIPFAMIGLLHALPGTPLQARMRAENRLRSGEFEDQFARSNFETILPEPVLLAGYRRVLETIYEPRRFFERMLAMMRHQAAHPSRPAPLNLRNLWNGTRVVVTQGFLSSYRREYWAFLREARRLGIRNLPEAILRGAIGHHFIEYTRRIVLPRLDRDQAGLASSLAARTDSRLVVMRPGS